VKKGPIIVIPIVVGIVIVVTMVLMQNQSSGPIKVDLPDKNGTLDTGNSTDIQKKLEEIEKINLENDYSPKPREWQTSGPFQIDRTKYSIGEKIFLIIGGLNPNEKGEVAFLRYINSTHFSVYITIPFDGAAKPAFNYYINPQISKVRGICSIDDIAGKWAVVFRGTDYPNLYFEITKDVVPGTNVDPVC